MDIALVFSGCHRRGGVERSVFEAARFLRLRHEVTVYAWDFEPTGLEGVRQVVLPPARGPHWTRPFSFARHARAALKSSQHEHVISFGVGDVGADVLWVNSVHRAWLQAARKLPKRSWKSPLLRYVLPRHLLLLIMEWRYFTRSSFGLVVVVAPAVGADLTRLYGVREQSLRTIHNGYARKEFSEARRRAARADARSAHGYAEGDVVLLMAANELARKGYPNLLQAMASLADPRLQLLLVGRADPAGYAADVEALGLTDKVRWAGSVEMALAHAAADVFVLPTQYEAFCLAIVEALASGLPVVTTAVAGAADVIRHGENGLLIQSPTDFNEIAAVLAVIANDGVRLGLADAAAESVRGLTWETLFGNAESLLEELSVRVAVE